MPRSLPWARTFFCRIDQLLLGRMVARIMVHHDLGFGPLFLLFRARDAERLGKRRRRFGLPGYGYFRRNFEWDLLGFAIHFRQIPAFSGDILQTRCGQMFLHFHSMHRTERNQLLPVNIDPSFLHKFLLVTVEDFLHILARISLLDLKWTNECACLHSLATAARLCRLYARVKWIIAETFAVKMEVRSGESAESSTLRLRELYGSQDR